MPLRLLLPLFLMFFATSARADEAVWRLLQSGGQVIVLRHATTVPGVGDPSNFKLGDCSTQRNLSEAGREEARRLGQAFRQRGISIGAVLSSAWCRCVDTAQLAFGKAEIWPGANSFFDNAAERPERTAALRQRVMQHRGTENLVIVTHQVNITALTGVYPAMGEMVVLSPDAAGGFSIAGRIKPQ